MPPFVCDVRGIGPFGSPSVGRAGAMRTSEKPLKAKFTNPGCSAGGYLSLVLVPAGVTMIATTWSRRRKIGASRPLESV